ncbi:MAG: nuclear transport factor 2 family protein [Pseudomonadales bacterium]|nr:nuclear transport factor 2 family protein [Pseudomonadales bacterium]
MKITLTGCALALLLSVYIPDNHFGLAYAGEAMNADFEKLADLNQGYLHSYRNGLPEFFEGLLDQDFRETSPDGTVLNKAQFLEKIASQANSSEQLSIEAGELEIQIFGDTAIVRAIPLITAADGTTYKGGRYTDVYVRNGSEWFCVAAHLGGTAD